MKISHFVIVAISLHYAGSAPTKSEKSLYKAIVEKCPSVKSIPKYQNLPLFQSCNGWTLAETNPTTNNTIAIRCLMYFLTFTQYCGNNTEKLNVFISKSRILDSDQKTVCDYMKTLRGALGKFFANEDNCEKVCLDELNTVHPVCGISYYFGDLHKAALPVATALPDAVKSQSADSERPNPETPNKIKSGTANTQLVAQADSNFNEKQNVPLNVIKIPQDPASENKNDETEKSVTTPDTAIASGENQDQEAKQMQNPNDVQENHHNDNEKPETQDQNPQNTPKDETMNQAAQEQNQQRHQQNNDGVNEVASKGDNSQINQQNMEEEVEEEGENGDDVESLDANEKSSKPLRAEESESVSYNTEMEGDSYFFTYFMILCIIFIVGYVCYHNKQKILALVLEGRRGKRQYRSRRPNSANYHKLDSNLEEAINSSCMKNANNVIY